MESRRASRSKPLWQAMTVLLGMTMLGSVSSQLAGDHSSSADYFVKSLPGAPSPLLKMHAGHIEITPEHHGNMFFWHFANRHISDGQKTVIWLNGGPGCSSMDGAFMEVGPYRVRGNKLELNDGGWDEFANLLFIDQPVGVGFSYVDGDSYLHELDEAANQVVTFLEKFFQLFPQYLDDDLYIAGESYAGQYIPYLGKAILERNKKAGSAPWNIAGLMIGNGWISGPEQYLAYLPFAYKEDLIQGGTPEADAVERQHSACMNALNRGGNNKIHVHECELILSEILKQTHDMPKLNGQCINMYDIRKTDSYSSCGMSWPEDLPDLNTYLARKDVVASLHINPDKKGKWKECSDQVGSAFTARNSAPSMALLPDLLAELPVLLFSGDRDLICNHLGTEAVINKLEFNNGTGMETSPGVSAPKLDWTFEGEPAGIYQEARNLTYVLFYNSSHMVPYDYPRRTRDMLNRFMGIDYDHIGPGAPASEIDGEPVNNGTQTEKEKEKLDSARWHAYYRSGEVALVVVLIAAVAWGWFVIRQRRKRGGMYKGLFGADDDDDEIPPMNGRLGLGKGRRDVEAADFDEAELDDLTGEGRADGRFKDDEERFDVGDDSGDEGEGMNGKAANGHK